VLKAPTLRRRLEAGRAPRGRPSSTQAGDAHDGITRRPARASGVRYRRLGSSDLEVSEISLGSWLTYGGGVGREQAEACVAKAFEVGINFIDTANVYARGAAESLLGEILTGRPRDTYILGTKLYWAMNGDQGLSREQVFKQ